WSSDVCSSDLGYQIIDGDALPVLLNEQVLRFSEARKTLTQKCVEFVDIRRRTAGLPRDGLNNGEQVLRAVRKLPHHETRVQLALSQGLLPRGNVAGCFHQGLADNVG